jgi:hypothetical protein
MRERTLLIGYLQRTQPVQWVAWWTQLSRGKAREALRALLFKGDSLRDLTSPTLRRRVIECVLQHNELREIVSVEANKALAQTTRRLMKKRLKGKRVGVSAGSTP